MDEDEDIYMDEDESDWFGEESDEDYGTSFFMLGDGADVPPIFPNKRPPPTPYDIVVGIFDKLGMTNVVSALAFLNREWCGAVRKLRFRYLHLKPGLDYALLLDITRSDTLLSYVRQVHINGHLQDETGADANHVWLPQLVPMFIKMLTQSPVDYIFLQSLSWGNVPLPIRTALLAFPYVRALGIHDVDFWNSNQFLRTLNAFPSLQYLQIWCANFWAYNHTPAQLKQKRPLLLKELNLGCSYTPLILEWMLGRRKHLAVQELVVASRTVYRDDARLAHVLKRISPHVRRIHYQEWGPSASCEGNTDLQESDIEALLAQEWVPQRPISIMDLSAEEEEEEMPMDVNDDDEDEPPEDGDMIEDEPDSDGDSYEVPYADLRKKNRRKWVPRIVDVSPLCLMPDDEGNITVEDVASEFARTQFVPDMDFGRVAFQREIKAMARRDSRLIMDMLESVEGFMYWRNAISLLTLGMLCLPRYTGEEFYRLSLTINFESPEVFDAAPWGEIDRLIYRASAPPRKVDRTDMRLVISVRDWDTEDGGKEQLMKLIRERVPHTVRRNHMKLSVGEWWRRPPPAGPQDWLQTFPSSRLVHPM